MNLFQIPAKICLRCGAYCVHTFTFFQSSFLLFLNQEPTFRCLLEVVRFRFSLFCVSPIHNSFTNFAVFVDTIPCSACLCVFRELSLSASILQLSHFTFLSWLLFMWRLRKALVLVTELHTMHLNSVLCFLLTCELISFPCFPVYSHREHFTLGIIMASGPFGLVFLGLGFVWRGGRLIPWSCRSTGAGAGGVMPRAKSRGVVGSGTPISSVFPASFFLIRASKSIFNRKYFQLILNMRGDRYQNVSVPKRKMRKD